MPVAQQRWEEFLYFSHRHREERRGVQVPHRPQGTPEVQQPGEHAEIIPDSLTNARKKH